MEQRDSISPTRSFVVKDSTGREWGTAIVQWSFEIEGLGESWSGWLRSSKDYEDVRTLFQRYEQISAQAHKNDGQLEDVQSEIAGLGVVLTDASTRKRYPVCPVFVSANMLITFPALDES